MKHTSDRTLDAIEPLLREIRAARGLVEPDAFLRRLRRSLRDALRPARIAERR